MIFRYRCISEEGNKIEGIIEASDKNSAAVELKKMFPLILELKEEKVGKKVRKVDKRDLIAFTDIMSISINAGLPIIKALELAVGNIQNKTLKEVINLVISSVRGGKLLSEALAMHSDVFDSLYIGVVRSGESSGELGKVFESLSRYLERSYNISSKIKSAMIYPLVVLSIALGVVFLFLTLVVPKFSEIYSSYSAELPQITQITIEVGNFVKDNFLIIVSFLGGFTWLVWYSYRRFDEVKNLVQSFVIKFLPPLGSFFVRSDVERFSRVMSIMLTNRVLILEALDTAMATLTLIPVKRAISFAITEVEKGRLLSEVLSEYQFFPSLFIQMLKVGEETGEIDNTLRKLADFYSFEIERQSEILTSALSPILIVIVGLIVAFLVLSLFMPMFSLQQILIR